MPDIDTSYVFVALPPEERARIAIQKLEEAERQFFEAQIGFALRKSEIPNDDAEALAAFTTERQQIMAQHKKRLQVAKGIYNEVKLPEPAEEPKKAAASKKTRN